MLSFQCFNSFERVNKGEKKGKYQLLNYRYIIISLKS